MVVTRKRSCSASEPGNPTDTQHTAKIKKQNGGAATPGSRATPRCVNSGEAPSTTTTTRTRRVTDSVVDAAPQSPRPSRTTRGSNNSSTQDIRTPVKTTRTESSSDEASDGSRCGRQLRVTLKDISTPSTPSARSKRVSGGEAGGQGASGVDAAAKTISSDSSDVAGIATRVSTPVRRSRRLSGSGVEEAQSQGTPKQLAFSVAKIIGGEGRKTKEDVGTKQNSLPIIKEDTEQAEGRNTSIGSPKTDGTEEEKINTKESDPTLQNGDEQMEKPSSAGQTLSDTESCVPVPDLPMPAEDKESISMETESKGKLLEEQTVDISICDGKPSIQNTTADTEGEKKDTIEGAKPIDSDKLQKTTSSDTDVSVESKKMKINSKEEEEQNNAISTSDTLVVTADPVKPTTPKDKPETVPIDEVTNESSTTQDTKVTSSALVDKNGNKNFSGINPLLPEVLAVDKKILKVIPELEKKIEQIRSTPKGMSISGKWWKKDKQRFRSINKDASGKKKWSKKMQLKQWREDVIAKSAAIEAEKKKKKEDLKERQRINKIRQEENAKKSEIVQVIKDPRKIKKMKRKQLRYIETRDTSNLKQV